MAIRWFKNKVIDPVKGAVTSGLSAKNLSMSLSVGLTAGLFPIPGLTTVPTIGLSYILGANIVVAQVVNMLCFALELAMVYPFMMAGRYILGGADFSFSLNDFELSLEALKHYARPFGYGVLAWTIMAPFMLGVVYYLLLYPAVYIVRVLTPAKNRES